VSANYLPHLSPFSLTIFTTLVVGVGCVGTIRINFSFYLFRNSLALFLV
jgi:hypothetical protein